VSGFLFQEHAFVLGIYKDLFWSIWNGCVVVFILGVKELPTKVCELLSESLLKIQEAADKD
jgi:hypothetical protein